jgi:hypothetical protein
MLVGLEEDEPKRHDVINAVGKRAFHGQLATDVLVAARSAGDGDREGRSEGGLALELDLPVPEHVRPVTQCVDAPGGKPDPNAVKRGSLVPVT